MPEILIHPEPFLKPRQFVYFTESWNVDHVKGKFFKVVQTQQITYEKVYIIDKQKHTTLTLDEDSGLLPERVNTLYEMYIGMKGNVLMYVRWPSTDYFARLEKAEFVPPEPDQLATLTDRRYIAYLDETITPYHQPRYREYTIKDMEPIQLVLYNDSVKPEKVVLRFLINRCKIEEIGERPVIYRTIFFYTDFKW